MIHLLIRLVWNFLISSRPEETKAFFNNTSTCRWLPLEHLYIRYNKIRRMSSNLLSPKPEIADWLEE
ncbi:MAG: hypothetical protein LBH58_13765 [Tannerellaceae bacterium]|nr:hypothetical protein [Tannerellaceae bacterium]